MAKTPVTLTINEFSKKNREVASFSMKFNQQTDIEGQVTSLPRGGKITLRVKALNDGNTDLVSWMIDPKKVYSGKITFRDTKENKVMKEIEFKDAYCVAYEEWWADSVKDVELAHYEDFTMSCRKISIGGKAKFSNTWELINPGMDNSESGKNRDFIDMAADFIREHV